MSTTTREARAASPLDGRLDGRSLIGMHVGDRYRLLELIGEGGMGGVFRAEQLGTRRIVALKLLHPELAHIEYVARRFEREAQAASRLSHPNIVEVLDFGESSGHLYLAMELLVGESLADAIARGDLGGGRPGALGRIGRLVAARPPSSRVAQTIAIMRQVLAALEHAHARGVVHRDLKPDNIMLLPPVDDAAPAHVKILDFGIAKLADDAPAGAKPLTQAGIPLGTPHYMSPEQAAGDATDARTDVYACGVILYEMLTGRPPFDAPSAVQLLSMQVTATPEPLRRAAPKAQIPEAVERVVLRALEKRREDRFASAAELRDALEAAGGGAARRHALPGRRYGQPRWLRVVAGTVAIAGALTVLFDHHASSAAPAVAAAPAVGRGAAVSQHVSRSRRPRSDRTAVKRRPTPAR